MEWAFRWLCNHPQVATVLSGLTSVEQVTDNLRIFDTVEPGCMSKEELELIDKVRDAYNSRIKAGCTGCAYCMPCPMGVDIPGSVLRVEQCLALRRAGKGNADYKRLEGGGQGPDPVRGVRRLHAGLPAASRKSLSRLKSDGGFEVRNGKKKRAVLRDSPSLKKEKMS